MKVAVLAGGRSLERHFPPQASWTQPAGGLFVWATLPDYINTTDLLARALRDNVAFVPGAAAFVDGRGTSSMRLNFSASGEDEIREGIRRIGRVVADQVELFETITAEHRVVETQRGGDADREAGRGRSPEGPAGGCVVPFRREGR